MFTMVQSAYCHLNGPVLVDGRPLKDAEDTLYKPQVFSLWFDHGVKPADEDYAYVVIPGIGADGVAESIENSIEILMNTTAIQGVYSERLGIVGLVFHSAGSFNIRGTTITVDEPCLLMYQINERKVTVSDPSCRLDSIQVDFFIDNDIQKSIPINLPQGVDAGRSASVTL